MGVKGAKHAAHYNKASSSSLRMVLREESLALGAKNGNENFGLDAFQGLLGRLNGKSEELLLGEENARRKVQIMMAQERRLGSLRFVTGGFLHMEEEVILEEKVPTKKRKRVEEDQHDPLLESAPKPKKSKKRRQPVIREDAKDMASAIKTTEVALTAEKRQSKRKQRGFEQADEVSQEVQGSEIEKTPGRRKDKPASVEAIEDNPLPRDAGARVETKEERKKRRNERKMARAERRARKEAQWMNKAQTTSQPLDGHNSEPREVSRQPNEEEELQKSQDAEVLSEPIPPVANPPLRARGRHLIRQRHIQQKKMSGVDEKALNEVFHSTIPTVTFSC